MKGSFRITVRNNRVQYKFTIERNLTILRGDSATGKTTLIGMIEDYENNGEDSGVNVQSDAPCTVLSGAMWAERLEHISKSIVFIDEGNPFVSTDEFARTIQNTDNYYVIAIRESLPSLPYSVDEIYGIKSTTRTKYPKIARTYNSFNRIYNDFPIEARPDVVVVEDSKSGFEFFKAVFARYGVECISAQSKAKIYSTVKERPEKNILVIADGAAFGPEIERVLTLKHTKNIQLYLPESFEWLILDSGVLKDSVIEQVLDDPSGHIESRDYFSWERFFTQFLTDKSRGTYLEYRKSKLNDAYLAEREMQIIQDKMPDFQ